MLGVVLVVGLLVVVGIVASRGQQQVPPVVGSGADLTRLEDRPAADKAFALPPATLEGFADGPEVNLADFRGEPLIVNFWATWCAPCVKEMPEFQKAYAEFGDEIAFLGVDVEDAPPNAEPFIERLGIGYPQAIDPQREFYLSLGNVGMPTTLLVDGDGIVRYRHTGPLDLPQLKALLRKHLNLEV